MEPMKIAVLMMHLGGMGLPKPSDELMTELVEK